MHRRIIAILICLAFLSSSPGFAQDRDATSRDLSGIHKSSRKYFWAVAGGTAVGLGLGIIAPGGSKSAFKGALIGGSATSAFYLIKDPNAAGEHRAFAHIVTNTLLGTGIFWTVCDCNDGALAGAFIGGGGTAIIQAFGTHNRNLAKLGGVSQATPPDDTPAAPGTPASSGAPAVASQPQTSAPARPVSQPAQAQNNSAQAAVPAAPATQSVPAQTQSVPAATQTAPVASPGDSVGTQGAPAQNQNPPLLPEDLTFSSDSNSVSNLNIGSASFQAAPPRPQK